MKKRILLTMGILSLAVIAFIVRNSYSPKAIWAKIDKLEAEVAANNNYIIETPQPETYDSLCRTEYNKQINFPVKEAAYAKLHSNRLFANSYDLSLDEMAELLKIFNDSSSYRWGELGTPEIHYYFTFHDHNANIIGLTTIDLGGMAYSYPPLYKMKWGKLNNMNDVLKLIQEIEN
jgi:hypothetical protein